MIAQRFRSLAGLVAVAFAALFFYILSLQVATERGRLEETDRKIADTRREIRRLQTELGTRASFRQLERWNSEALALGAPRAGQYLESEHDIALIDQVRPSKPNDIPPAVMASASRLAEEEDVSEQTAVALLGDADADVQLAIAGGLTRVTLADAKSAVPAVKPRASAAKEKP